jgi:hypothetical protein
MPMRRGEMKKALGTTATPTPVIEPFLKHQGVDTHKQETSLWASASISSVKIFVKSSL